MNLNVRTDYLFPKTNFAVGLGSIVSVYGSYFEYNYSETNENADTRAIASDWQMVGKDIQEAILSFYKAISKNY